MQSTQHANRCQVIPHPACTTNPDAVRAVQQATGQLLVINDGKPQLTPPNFYFITGAVDPFPTTAQNRRVLIAEEISGPCGGDAA
ncbi:hypothetical protein LU646_14780 [Pseudomonas alloputida]|uniref:hypothetical protein n=1 Tax=Pseudomonas putida group TaxID=136845 RepID=UPI001E5B86E7|nr:MULTISPECIES: hypothetical protein [Pseudomonas putida group]MCE1017265.1 hypothetical protein [Pseudomonas monteilii]MCE1059144.1 hypothetical protein [Pseudomonas alloputida]